MAPGRVDLDQCFALSLDLLCVTGSAGRFVHLDDAWETTPGWPVDEFRGRRAVPFRVVGGPELRRTVRRLGELLLAAT